MKNSEKISKLKDCPVRNVLDRIGDKWSILILLVLEDEGKLRFSEINQMVSDISQKMLTVTLRTLEADGLVSREIYAEIPPRVEYELTKLGKSLIPIVRQLTQWANENMDIILATRQKFAVKKSA